jgi:hypothetical protein
MPDYTPKEIRENIFEISGYDLTGTFNQAIQFLKERRKYLAEVYPKYSDFILEYGYQDHSEEKGMNIIGIRLETFEEVEKRRKNDVIQAESEVKNLKAQKARIEERLKKLNQ